MKKRLQFFISLIMICVMAFGVFSLPASSFSNDVETSTNNMLLVNLDTHTTVFSERADNMWYQGNLSRLMTFILANEMIDDPAETEFKVEQSFIDSLPYSDGCLKPFIGKTLTAEDLEAIMLLTSGSDAAYALADIISKGDYNSFISLMEKRAVELGCTGTTYMSPGYSSDIHHHTSCSDLLKIYLEVTKYDFYSKVMGDYSYTPKGLDEKDFTVKAEASIMNENSPYYFRYCNDAVFSYTKDTNACIVLTTTYRDKTYFFAGIFGLNENERNVYADAKKLTTWAYKNLSDRKAIDTADSLAHVNVDTGWGNYQIGLFSFTSEYKTLPNDFDPELLSYSVDVPDSIKWPLFKGQSLGKAVVSYDSEVIDNVDLSLSSNEGVSILSDTAKFGNSVFGKLFPARPIAYDASGKPVATGDEKPLETAPKGTEG